MALQQPLYMQPASGDAVIAYTAQEDRAGLLGMTFSREGVHDLRGGHLKVAQRAAGANFTVDVAAGRCAIQGDDISDQGIYICNSTTVLSVVVPAKPASGSRTHRVVARVRDKLSNGTWSQYDWVIELLADTGSGTPAEPNSAITLAMVTVSSATVSITTGNIVDARKRSSTGTAALQGTFTPSPNSQTAGYWQSDSNRPLTWSVNPDGWVQLAGFMVRTGANTAVLSNTQYQVTEVLDAAIRPANASYRDFAVVTRDGVRQMSLMPGGYLGIRFFTNDTFFNGCWISFDGSGYRL